VGKWEILGIIDECVNNETQILLQYWDLHGQNVGEVWNLLEWIAWDSFEFEKTSRVYDYSFHDPYAFYARSYYALFWCDVCNSSDHSVGSCPYYACYAYSDSSLPLAQCKGLEVGESLRLVARFGMNNACRGLEDTFDMEHNLVDTPLEVCRDVFVHEETPSLGSNHVSHNPLEHFHDSLLCSQPFFSPEYYVDVPKDISKLCDFNVDLGCENNMFNMLRGNDETFESLGNFSGYDATLDPYCIHLVENPRKIMWNTFFNFSFAFSMAFSLIKRALAFFALILSVLSYWQA